MKENKQGAQKKINWFKLAAVAGALGMRYRKPIIHKLLWIAFKRALPYILLALIILIVLVAGLTFLFVKLFS